MGRGVVPRLRLAAVRPDARSTSGARTAERALRGGSHRGPCPVRRRAAAPSASARATRARPGTGTARRRGRASSARADLRSCLLRARTAASSCCLALLLGGALAAIVIAKVAVRRGRYLTRDPRRLAAACRRELADYLVDQNIDAARSATLHELGSLVRHELAVEPDAFVAAATAARFGPPAGAERAAHDARRELRKLTRAMRGRMRTRDRLRGLVSLRSFGFAA